MTGLSAAGPQELQDFAGRWRLIRRIDDALAGEVLEGEGWGEFRPAPDGGLIYDEEVWLTAPGRPALRGTRRYLWRPLPGGIAVFFDDGRPFHRIALAAAAAEDRHDCAPDLYRVRYDFSGWPVWSARWQVAGPRKSYVMTSMFSPAQV